MITISDIRAALGDAYSTTPDDATIQKFINRREEELKDLIGSDLQNAPYQNILKKWLLNKVCIDVLMHDLLGIDSADVLEYSIGDLKESKNPNIQLKLQWIEIMKEAANEALKTYMLKTKGYRSVRL